MNTAHALRNEMVDVYKELRNGTIEVEVARELANIAGKIVRSAATQVAYNVLRKDTTTEIAFLKEPTHT